MEENRYDRMLGATRPQCDGEGPVAGPDDGCDEPGTENQIRPLTHDLYNALLLDVWPTRAACIDFGILSEAHYGALQFAVNQEEVTVEQLHAALGKGAALQALISPRNPYRDVTFRTAWDDLNPEPEELEP